MERAVRVTTVMQRQVPSSSTHQPAAQLARQGARKKKTEEEEKDERKEREKGEGERK